MTTLSPSQIGNNINASPKYPLAQSIVIKLPTRALQMQKNGEYKLVPVFKLNGCVDPKIIKILPDRHIIRPVLENRGKYASGSTPSRYALAKQAQADIVKYDPNAPEPPAKKINKQGIMKKIPQAKPPTSLYTEWTKPILISAIRLKDPTITYLQSKKKAELIAIFEKLSGYAPYEELSTLVEEPVVEEPVVEEPQMSYTKSEPTYNEEIIVSTDTPSFSRREMQRMIEDRRIKYNSATVTRGTPTPKGLRIRSAPNLKFFKDDPKFVKEQRAINKLIANSPSPEDKQRLIEMKQLHREQYVTAVKAQQLAREQARLAPTRGKMLLNTTKQVLGFTGKAVGLLGKVTLWGGYYAAKGTIAVAKGTVAVAKEVYNVSVKDKDISDAIDAVNDAMRENKVALDAQVVAKTTAEFKKIEGPRVEQQKEAEELARALAEEAERKRQSDMRYAQRLAKKAGSAPK